MTRARGATSRRESVEQEDIETSSDPMYSGSLESTSLSEDERCGDSESESEREVERERERERERECEDERDREREHDCEREEERDCAR